MASSSSSTRRTPRTCRCLQQRLHGLPNDAAVGMQLDAPAGPAGMQRRDRRVTLQPIGCSERQQQQMQQEEQRLDTADAEQEEDPFTVVTVTIHTQGWRPAATSAAPWRCCRLAACPSMVSERAPSCPPCRRGCPFPVEESPPTTTSLI